jgi:hypothetical protein
MACLVLRSIKEALAEAAPEKEGFLNRDFEKQ